MIQARRDSKWMVLQSNLKQAVNNFKITDKSFRSSEENSELKGRERTRTISINDEEISINEFSLVPTKVSNQPKSIIKNNRRKSVVSVGERDAFMNQYLKETQLARRDSKVANQPQGLNISKKSNKNISRFQDLYSNFSNIYTGFVPLQEEEEEKKLYEPTYRTDPVEKINRALIEDSIEKILISFLNKINVMQTMLSSSSVRSSMQNLTFTIKNKTKSHVSNRYKLVVNCTVIENRHQGMIVASECLWDQTNDVCITVKKERQNYIFIVNLFAVYHE